MADRKKLPLTGVGRRQIGSAERGSLPVYHQLNLIIGQRIRDHVYEPGELLPSEYELASQFAVSRVSVRRTLALLERDGLIVRRRGVGTFVADRTGAGTIAGMIENLITIGFETEATLLSAAPDPAAPAFVGGTLALEPGEVPVCIRRLRSHRGTPFSLSAVWLAPRHAALIDTGALGADTTVAALEAAGIRAATAEQTVGATLADHETGIQLGVAMGSALVLLRRTVRDAANGPLICQQSLYRPDRYEYHMLLTRDQSAGRPRWRHIG